MYTRMSGVIKSMALIVVLTHGADCGILTGDLKLKSKPLTINSHHAPISININTDKLKTSLPSLSLPKPAKPPPLLKDLLKPSLFAKSKLLSSTKLSQLSKFPSLRESLLLSPFKPSIFSSKSLLSSKSILPSRKSSRSSILDKPELPPLRTSKLSKLPSLSKPRLPSPTLPPLVPVLPPVLPKVPFLPVPLLPPFIPPVPLLPLPLIPPIVPGIPLGMIDPLRPLRVPILGKSPLQKALGSEVSPVVVEMKEGTKNVILEKKLRNLLKRGSLTTAEFNRFRRLLLS